MIKMERNALDESAKRVMEYKLERKALDKKTKKTNANKKQKQNRIIERSLERNALFC